MDDFEHPAVRRLRRMAHSAPEKPAGESDKVQRYVARLNRHLAGLDGLERHAFLIREQAKWLRRYEQFATAIDGGAEPPAGVTASDYLLTLCAINKHLVEHI